MRRLGPITGWTTSIRRITAASGGTSVDSRNAPTVYGSCCRRSNSERSQGGRKVTDELVPEKRVAMALEVGKTLHAKLGCQVCIGTSKEQFCVFSNGEAGLESLVT